MLRRNKKSKKSVESKNRETSEKDMQTSTSTQIKMELKNAPENDLLYLPMAAVPVLLCGYLTYSYSPLMFYSSVAFHVLTGFVVFILVLNFNLIYKNLIKANKILKRAFGADWGLWSPYYSMFCLTK